jgi:hypothetical protein
MAWCEDNSVDYLFRPGAEPAARRQDRDRACRRCGEEPQNRQAATALCRIQVDHARQLEPAAARDRQGRTHQRGGQSALCRHLAQARRQGALSLYDKVYCARGDIENRIKECQLDRFADRTSTATLRANQLRLWFASMAYVLLCALRRIGLRHTAFAKATCGTSVSSCSRSELSSQ